jgi:hypothetical protein
MINNKLAIVFFVLFLLFPAVFAAEYKQVQAMDIPKCYDNITFKIEGTPPIDSDSRDFEIIGCPRPRPLHCPCGDGDQTLQFSVLDNVSNTISIIAQYYIAPHIEFTANESQTYDPNSDNMRTTRWTVKVEPAVAVPVEEENPGTPVDSGKLLLLVFGIILVIGGGIAVLIKVLSKGEKKSEVKTKINTNKSQQPPKKVEGTNDDVKKYLNELEEERRKNK